MPTITCTIDTTEEEQNKVYDAISLLNKSMSAGTPMALSTISLKAGINPNRVRYILDDLVAAGRVKKIPVKAFNRHYIRYTYELC